MPQLGCQGSLLELRGDNPPGKSFPSLCKGPEVEGLENLGTQKRLVGGWQGERKQVGDIFVDLLKGQITQGPVGHSKGFGVFSKR